MYWLWNSSRRTIVSLVETIRQMKSFPQQEQFRTIGLLLSENQVSIKRLYCRIKFFCSFYCRPILFLARINNVYGLENSLFKRSTVEKLLPIQIFQCLVHTFRREGPRIMLCWAPRKSSFQEMKIIFA